MENIGDELLDEYKRTGDSDKQPGRLADTNMSSHVHNIEYYTFVNILHFTFKFANKTFQAEHCRIS